jgi:hypothetical protein
MWPGPLAARVLQANLQSAARSFCGFHLKAQGEKCHFPGSFIRSFWNFAHLAKLFRARSPLRWSTAEQAARSPPNQLPTTSGWLTQRAVSLVLGRRL